MTFRHILIGGGIFAVVALVVVKFQNEATSSLNEKVASPAPFSTVAAPGARAGPDHIAPLQSILASAPLARNVEGQPALAAPDPRQLSTTDRSPLANLLGARGTKPEAEPGIVLDLLKSYRRLFGAYPAGEGNRQFVNALLGANKEKLPLLPSDHPRINAQGEIVDAWGTPFYFHQNSRASVEVRSAGVDRVFYTEDDIVAGKPPPTLGESVIASEDSEDR